MTRFIDDIDRMFEELVHEVWRSRAEPPKPTARHATIEFRLPLHPTPPVMVEFRCEDSEVVVVASSHGREAASGAREPQSGRGRFEHRLAIPAGTEPEGFEAHFEPFGLLLRVTLRRRSGG